MRPTPPRQLPDLPGADIGVKALRPLVVQCGRCDRFYAGHPRRDDEAELATSEAKIHVCDPQSPRYCPTCYLAVLAACPHTDHSGGYLTPLARRYAILKDREWHPRLADAHAYACTTWGSARHPHALAATTGHRQDDR